MKTPAQIHLFFPEQQQQQKTTHRLRFQSFVLQVSVDEYGVKLH